MPTWSMGLPETSKLSLEKKVEALENFLIETNKRLSWITARFDSRNVKRLDTNETVIKSADGETHIDGPLLKMYDKQATPVLRLKQGYDAATGDFVFYLYNELGNATVYIDSNGNAVFTGTITGSTITGGTLQTNIAGNNRIVMTNDSLVTYNSSDQINGMAFGTVVGGNYGDVYFYSQGTAVMQFYNTISDGYQIMPLNSKKLILGAGGSTTLCYGTWNFSSSTVTGLSTSTDGSHDHGGAVPSDGSHDHSVTT